MPAAPATFDAQSFLRDRWGDPDALGAFLKAYGHDVQRPMINQWFRRGRLPTEWGMTLLALLEMEMGAPPSVAKYLS
jgi:hypothetical protein